MWAYRPPRSRVWPPASPELVQLVVASASLFALMASQGPWVVLKSLQSLQCLLHLPLSQRIHVSLASPSSEKKNMFAWFWLMQSSFACNVSNQKSKIVFFWTKLWLSPWGQRLCRQRSIENPFSTSVCFALLKFADKWVLKTQAFHDVSTLCFKPFFKTQGITRSSHSIHQRPSPLKFTFNASATSGFSSHSLEASHHGPNHSFSLPQGFRQHTKRIPPTSLAAIKEYLTDSEKPRKLTEFGQICCQC